MDITDKDILKLIDLYFREKNILYRHLYDSYHQFVDELIPNELTNYDNVFHESITADKIYRYKFIFEDIAVRQTKYKNVNKQITPEYARKNMLTYSLDVVATVKQIQEVIDIATDEVKQVIIGEPEYNHPVARIPIMVRSRFCTTQLNKEEKNTECDYDPGGYFIVNGNEKVVLCVERMCENKPYVFTKKEAGYKNNLMYSCQINSRVEEVNGNIQPLVIKMKKDESIVINIQQFKEIPLFVMFRALGIVTDKDIIRYISYDYKTDIDMVNVLRMSINNAVPDQTKPISELNPKIETQEDAIEYLISKLRKSKKYSTTDADIQKSQQKIHLEKILKKDLLPHIGDNLIEKAYYIGYMINRMLQCYLGRISPDNRDDYINKRIDTPGVLLHQLFRQYFRKLLKDCGSFFKKKNNNNDNPLSIISQIKPNTIESGIKSGLLTGTWGASKRKKGVSQVLKRTTFPLTIAYLRRIITPGIDASKNKIVSIRHVNNIQYGFICAVETPEGARIGLIKALSMMTSITRMLNSQINIITELLDDKIINLQDIDPIYFKQYTKVFLNGKWLGVVEKPLELVDFMKEERRNFKIDSTVSISFNYYTKEIKIYCDDGRLFRPLLRVDDNNLMLKHEMINNISKNMEKNKIIKWNDFIFKYPNVIENIDIEETPSLLISMRINDLITEKIKSTTVITDPKKNGDEINRYMNTYKKFTHCELHPALSLGTISSNIPFPEHNQSPRNIYNFSQSKQALGIYATNYRYRMDTGYKLYHSQRPLVYTRGSKYIHTYNLPAGENVVVAIASYGGYNQEDSIIMNKTAIDRGLFRVSHYRSFTETIQKNQVTSQDDEFTKPDKDRVLRMDPNVCYDKLNDKGYIPIETYIVKGDAIIGKISPIQPIAGSNKVFRDSSKIYKYNVPAYVDTVHTDIINQDGYQMYAMKTRSERIPIIGDKFCCYSDDTEIMTDKGWITFDQLTLDHKVGSLVDNIRLDYVKPSDIQKYDYKGKMYKIETDKVNLLVTPNHRMYVRKEGESNYGFELAENIVGEKRYYKINSRKEVTVNEKNKQDKLVDYKGKIYCCTVPSGVLYVRRDSKLVLCGNSRHAQKGTVGILYRSEDMPFTKDGVQPDLIINPNAIPSRMTIGQIIECVLGKVAAIKGKFIDGTAFNNIDIDTIRKMLNDDNFDDEGFETLYCGMTGERIKTKIFIGPTYYMRLTHMVEDKIHSRARGPMQMLTRQPPEGQDDNNVLAVVI